MVHSVPVTCRVFLVFYCLLKGFAAGSTSDYDGVEVVGNSSWATDDFNVTNDFNVQHETNITLRGGGYTGHKTKPGHRKVMPDPPPYDPNLAIYQICRECDEDDEYCEKPKEGVVKKITKAIIHNTEARTAHILALARKQCRENNFVGQIEIAATACFRGVSLSTGAWTQLGEQTPTAHETLPGNNRDRTYSEDHLKPYYDNVLTKAAYGAVEQVIKLSLIDMAERAEVWQDPKVFAHAAMDRSALTRNLVIADPFLGMFSVRLYFRLWLHDFSEKHSEKKSHEKHSKHKHKHGGGVTSS